MSNPTGPSKSERKKARRRQREQRERSAGQELDSLADDAVAAALAVVAEVADAPNRVASEQAIDVAMPTLDAARFVLKRVNDALAPGEWLNEVEAWVWDAHTSTRPALTAAGRVGGVELRLEQLAAS